ncbi:unnamed protein product [Adineta steineri]|uniref:Uncharacterized protein n=1 Tax=Adineta steineri TaxID=433720 RepID=A0A816EQR5_9BILA|nr:unnamed protein product [Adineta steineri]CAF1650660.1 unnamed protein product [Adineta steineri]
MYQFTLCYIKIYYVNSENEYLNKNNNGQLHQKLLRDDAEPANIDSCHRSLILKFVDLLDGAEYSVGKMSGTKTSVHTG